MSHFFAVFLSFSALLTAFARCEDFPGKADPSAQAVAETEHATPGVPMPVWLADAVALASQMTDGDFQTEIQLQVVDQLLADSQLDAASGVAKSIAGHRGGIALARAAAVWGRAGEADKATELLVAIERLPKQLTPAMDEAIKAEVAVALAAGGETEKAKKAAELIRDEPCRIFANARIAVEALKRGGAFSGMFFDVDTTKPKIMPEVLAAARGLIDIAEFKLSGSAGKSAHDEVLQLCEQAGELIEKSKALAGEEYLDLGILCRSIGRPERAAHFLGVALTQMPVGVDMHSWRQGYFAKLVEAYWKSGNQAEVKKLLDAARAGIANQHRYYQPRGLCSVAEAYLALCDDAEAEKLWLEAVEIAVGNPNPDSKMQGCAAVALSMHRSGRGKPERIAEHFAKLIPSELKMSSTK